MIKNVLERYSIVQEACSILELGYEYALARQLSDLILPEILSEVYPKGLDNDPVLFEHRCSMCYNTKSDVTLRTRNTMYEIDIWNYHVVCAECDDIDRQQMDELWSDVYSDIYEGLR